MKLTLGVAVGLVLGSSTIAETVAGESMSTEPTSIIGSEQMLGQCLEQVQREYFQVCLPSLTERLLQPAGSFPVVWDSFSPETRQQFRGWIDENGIVHHTVGLYQDYWTDEIVVLDDSGWEIFRIERDKLYDKYDLQREFFDLGKKEVLVDEFTREIFLPSKIATLVDLVPLVFWDAHVQFEQEAAAQQEALAEQAGSLRYEKESEEVVVGMSLVSAAQPVAAEPMAMAAPLSSPPAVPEGDGDSGEDGGGGSTGNLLVELAIHIPEGFGYMNHIELFAKDDLVYSLSWELPADGEWIPTHGRQTVYWIDSESSNKTERFYLVADGADTDGDGRSDFYESISGTESNVFDAADLNSNGINDWWDEKIFGQVSTNQGLMDDTDGDGLTNYMEIAVNSMGRVVSMTSDPNLEDSDADGLEDKPERMVWFTEPMNPDTDGDGLEDGEEINASPRTDPHNSDTLVPSVAFSGS